MPPLSGMLSDSIDGSLSSKRVVTLSAFLLCATAFIANLFFQLKIDQFIFDSMAYIAMAGLGATVAEKFSSRPAYNSQLALYQRSPISTQIRGTPLPRQEYPEL
jgi:hypothetical protein